MNLFKTARGALRREIQPLLLMLLASAATAGFLALGGEIQEKDTRALDRELVLALRTPGDGHQPIGPFWLPEVAEDLTALGGVGVLTLLTIIVGGYLVLDGHPRLALMLVLAMAGGAALAFGLKEVYQRARPDVVTHLAATHTKSFPSGHSFLSATAWLTLGAMVARANRRRRVKIYAIATAMGVAGLVGVTRVYLGVHWPTDVLAGWTGGAAWALIIWSAALWLQRRGTVEKVEAEETA